MPEDMRDPVHPADVVRPPEYYIQRHNRDLFRANVDACRQLLAINSKLLAQDPELLHLKGELDYYRRGVISLESLGVLMHTVDKAFAGTLTE